MSRLRGALVGLGVMGAHHARLMASSDTIDFVGIADPFFEGRTYGDVPMVKDVSQLVHLGLDFAVVASPTAFHHELGMMLLQEGINLLIEKPLASSSFESQQLLHAAATSGVVGAVGHIERFNPAIIKMKELLEQGLLGDLFQISTVRTGPFPSRISDVGVAKDLASHDVDLAMWLTSSSYEEISAKTFTSKGRVHEDFFVASGKMKSGQVVSHSVNWMSPIKERETRVVGQNGMLVADTLRSELHYHEAGMVLSPWEQSSFQRGPIEGNSTRFALARTEPILAEHLAFESLLIGKPSSIATFEDGCRVLEVIEKSLSS